MNLKSVSAKIVNGIVRTFEIVFSIGKWTGRGMVLFFNAARRIGVAFGIVGSFALGLAFALAGGYLATASGAISIWRFVLPVKAIGLVGIAVGCFVSGWLAACFTASAVKLGDRDRDRLRNAEQKAGETEMELKKEREERVQAQRKLVDAQKEMKAYAARGINISAIESILQLALAKSELYVTDFEGEWIPETFRNPPVGSPSIDRYVEVFRKPFEATFGIDLKDIKISEHNGVLLIDGLQAKKISSHPKQDDQYEWPLVGQLQTYRLKKVRWDEETEQNWPSAELWKIAKGPEPDKKGQKWVWVVDEGQKDFSGHLKLDSAIVQKRQEEHRKRVEAEVYGTEMSENSVDNRFKFINDTIVEMGKKIITNLLAPLGKEIIILDKKQDETDEQSDWKPLIDFCQESNKLLENGQ